jgi:anti-sigma B factor antagonist
MAGVVTCEAATIDDGLLITVSGEIDFISSAQLHVDLLEHLAQQPQRMILDLGRVTYMDSSGLAMLVQALSVQTKRNAKLVLCNLAERVRGIFQIARLDKIFTIVANAEQAKVA